MASGSNLPATGSSYSGGDRQQFCVSWNSHQSNMHSAFPKLLSSEQFVDVTLACDGGSIKCHRVVLSACSDYLERLLLDIPCSHPVIFLRDTRMWELHALVEFMYRGEVYVEQQQLAKLMQAAEALQIRGLSTQGRENLVNEAGGVSQQQQQQGSSTSSAGVSSVGMLGGTSGSSLGAGASEPMNSPERSTSSDYKADDTLNEGDLNSSDFLDASIVPQSETASPSSSSVQTNAAAMQGLMPNYMNMEHTEALQHLEKALSACEATLTETQGMVKMEPDEQFSQQQDMKPYSISMVPSGMNCSPGSPFPAIEGYQRRQRRSEEELKQASDMVARGMTFQVASEKYKIPISTIRFYMVRKGILKRRKRGRGSSHLGVNMQPTSPASPPFHMMNYRLPEGLNSSLQ